MVRITVEKFAKKYVEGNPGEKIEDVKSRLKAALKEKLNGGKCQVCGSANLGSWQCIRRI